MHAIIIEKDYLNAQLIKQCLLKLGYKTFGWADTASDAVAAAYQCQPDLVTADVQLREGSGIDAARDICALSAAPVLFVVGNPESLSDTFPEAHVLYKPFALRELTEAVEQAVTDFDQQFSRVSIAA